MVGKLTTAKQTHPQGHFQRMIWPITSKKEIILNEIMYQCTQKFSNRKTKQSKWYTVTFTPRNLSSFDFYRDTNPGTLNKYFFILFISLHNREAYSFNRQPKKISNAIHACALLSHHHIKSMSLP